MDATSTLQKLAIGTLVSVAVIALMLRLNIAYNSLYMDEAGYSFVGKLLLDGGSWNTKHYVFSSDVPLVLLGVADKLLPDVGGRLLSLVFGLVSLWLMFRCLQLLNVNRYLALCGLLVLALQPSHLMVSKMATYDSFCLLLLSLCLYWLCLGIVKDSLLYIIAAALGLSGAILSKYIGIAYLPLLSLVLLLEKPRYTPVLISIVVGIIALYLYRHWDALQHLYQQQVMGTHGSNTGRVQVLGAAAMNIWPLLVAVFLLVASDVKVLKSKGLLLLLLLASPLLVYHFLSANLISLYKHMVYPSLFLTGLLVFLLQRHPVFSKPRYYLPAMAVLVLALMGNARWQLQQFETAWPDTQLVLEQIDYKKGDYILSEDTYLLRNAYYQQRSSRYVYDTNWYDPGGRGIHDRQQLQVDIQSNKFKYLYFNTMVTPELSKKLMDTAVAAGYEQLMYESVPTSSLVAPGAEPVLALYRRQSDSREQYKGGVVYAQ